VISFSMRGPDGIRLMGSSKKRKEMISISITLSKFGVPPLCPSFTSKNSLVKFVLAIYLTPCAICHKHMHMHMTKSLL